MSHLSREEILAKTSCDAMGTVNKLWEGIGGNLEDRTQGQKLYAKNWMFAHGACAVCDNYNARFKEVGSHCKLPKEKWCVK